MKRLPRRAQMEGYDYSNWFQIRFDRWVVGAEGIAREDMPIYIHEYWHYLQNTTTIAGFYSFALSQQLIALFSHTGRSPTTGESSGSAALTRDLTE